MAKKSMTMAEDMVRSILYVGGFTMLAKALNNVCYHGEIIDEINTEIDIDDALNLIYDKIIPDMEKIK